MSMIWPSAAVVQTSDDNALTSARNRASLWASAASAHLLRPAKSSSPLRDTLDLGFRAIQNPVRKSIVFIAWRRCCQLAPEDWAREITSTSVAAKEVC